jgi:hypothetical protein
MRVTLGDSRGFGRVIGARAFIYVRLIAIALLALRCCSAAFAQVETNSLSGNQGAQALSQKDLFFKHSRLAPISKFYL